MKKIIWKGSITLTATAILPADATMQDVAEALVAQLDMRLNLCTPISCDEVQDIEAIGVIE